MVFHDCDENEVEYDGSPLSWRISAYAVIIKDDQILILKNRSEKLFDVPGGGVEMDESIEQAIQREAMEEAGAKIQIGKLVSISEDYFYHREEKAFFKTIQLFYTATLNGELGKPLDPRTEQVSFIPIEKLSSYPLPTAVQKALTFV